MFDHRYRLFWVFLNCHRRNISFFRHTADYPSMTTLTQPTTQGRQSTTQQQTSNTTTTAFCTTPLTPTHDTPHATLSVLHRHSST